MRAIESVIKMMDPTFKINRIAVRRQQPNSFFKRGTISRVCLDVLRTAERPLTVREVIERAYKLKVHDPNAERIAKVRVVFHNTLRNQIGKAVRVTHEGPIVRWELANKG